MVQFKNKPPLGEEITNRAYYDQVDALNNETESESDDDSSSLEGLSEESDHDDIIERLEQWASIFSAGVPTFDDGDEPVATFMIIEDTIDSDPDDDTPNYHLQCPQLIDYAHLGIPEEDMGSYENFLASYLTPTIVKPTAEPPLEASAESTVTPIAPSLSTCSTCGKTSTSTTPSKCSTCVKLLKKYGKRTVKRATNNFFLQCLDKTLEEEKERDPPEIFSPNPSIFSQLFENVESNEVWNEFMQSSEEQQLKFLESAEQQQTRRQRRRRRRASNKQKQTLQKEEEEQLSDEKSRAAFNRLTEPQKSLLQQRDPHPGIDRFEQNLLSFFTDHPTETYISPQLSSFERLIIHTIANFYGLKSASFNTDAGQRLTKVECREEVFNIPAVTLTKYIKKFHKDKRTQ